MNGDGFDDVIVGAPNFDGGQVDSGRALVYLGSAGGPALDADWTATSDQASTLFGLSVAAAGDVNGDGFDDVIVGAHGYDNGETNEGRAFLFLGSAGGLSALPAWTAEADQAHAYFGISVAGAGDVNGDGFDDVIVGAPNYDNQQINEGRAFLYLGSPSGPALAPSWIAEVDDGGAAFGTCVAGAGDVDGDGFDDVLVGAYKFSNGHSNEGAAFLYTGSPSGPALAPDWSVEGGQSAAFLGLSVAGAGDVDGDGFADVLVGAYGYEAPQPNEGRTSLYVGSPAGLNLAWSGPGVQPHCWSGYSVAGAGDVNGDGFDDLIVGAPRFDHGHDDEGRALLYLGSATSPAGAVQWTGESDQTNARYGHRVAGAGDVDGDGFDDVLVGAYLFDAGEPDEGRATLHFGQPASDCNANGQPDHQDIASGVSQDRDVNWVPDECETTGVPFCFGDGSATPCPCGNAGVAGHGCANGWFAEGAQLIAFGTPSVSADDLVLRAFDSRPGQPGIFFQGEAALNGGLGIPFGDGLRCAGVGVVRLGLVDADGIGSATSAASIVTAGGAAPGDVRRYQWWYRDPVFSPCDNDFNLSNGVEVSWQP